MVWNRDTYDRYVKSYKDDLEQAEKALKDAKSSGASSLTLTSRADHVRKAKDGLRNAERARTKFLRENK